MNHIDTHAAPRSSRPALAAEKFPVRKIRSGTSGRRVRAWLATNAVNNPTAPVSTPMVWVEPQPASPASTIPKTASASAAVTRGSRPVPPAASRRSGPSSR